MLGFVCKVSILHSSCLGFLVIGSFSPFAKPVRKIVKTRTYRRYTLVRLVRCHKIMGPLLKWAPHPYNNPYKFRITCMLDNTTRTIYVTDQQHHHGHSQSSCTLFSTGDDSVQSVLVMLSSISKLVDLID